MLEKLFFIIIAMKQFSQNSGYNFFSALGQKWNPPAVSTMIITLLRYRTPRLRVTVPLIKPHASWPPLAMLSVHSVRLWRCQEQAGRETDFSSRGVTGKGQVLPATAVPLLSLCCLGRGGCGDIFLLKTLGDFNMYSGPRLGTLSYLWIKKPTL